MRRIFTVNRCAIWTRECGFGVQSAQVIPAHLQRYIPNIARLSPAQAGLFYFNPITIAP